MLLKKALTKEAEAKTSVWWDMDSCPVPSGYDAGRIRECMERALEKLGYSSPVTMITATGNLKETPEHVLRELSSTKIILNHSSNVFHSLFSDFCFWTNRNPPPATVMFITNRGNAKDAYGPLSSTQDRGYDLVLRYDLTQLLEDAKDSDSLGSSEIIMDSETSEPSESPRLFCQLCNFPTQSLESFTTHLSGEEHAHRVSMYLLVVVKQEFQTTLVDKDSHPKTSNTIVMKKQPKKNQALKQTETLLEANKVKKTLKKSKKKLVKKMRTELPPLSRR